jgi:hypothetical protein
LAFALRFVSVGRTTQAVRLTSYDKDSGISEKHREPAEFR